MTYITTTSRHVCNYLFC